MDIPGLVVIVAVVVVLSAVGIGAWAVQSARQRGTTDDGGGGD